jgi:hypothetical protein
MASGEFRPIFRQRGAALLIFLLLFFLGSMSWLLAQGRADALRRTVDESTVAALAEAREALSGRAAQDDNRPGSLTCPDTDDDGVANQVGGNCTAYIGRLPWKTLDVADLRDGWGERLWYALTPELRDNPAAHPIHRARALQLSLDGIDNHAALIFSAGPPLAGQNGRPSNAVADYLDGGNGDGDSAYVSGSRSAPFNDVVLPITRDELFRVVGKRVLAEIRGPDGGGYGLRHHFASALAHPWADTDGDGHANGGANSGRPPYRDIGLDPEQIPANPVATWLYANGWPEWVSYRRDDARSATLLFDEDEFLVVQCPSSPCP